MRIVETGPRSANTLVTGELSSRNPGLGIGRDRDTGNVAIRLRGENNKIYLVHLAPDEIYHLVAQVPAFKVQQKLGENYNKFFDTLKDLLVEPGTASVS